MNDLGKSGGSVSRHEGRGKRMDDVAHGVHALVSEWNRIESWKATEIRVG